MLNTNKETFKYLFSFLDDKQNGLQLLTAILKISNQLDSLSIKTKSESSTTDGTQACKNINNSYIYYALREDIRKLRELQKTKSRNGKILVAVNR